MRVGFLTQVVACALYLAPVAVVLLWRSNRKTFAAEAVMAIPAAMAADMFLCLLASRLLPLDVVLIASRGVYLGAGILQLFRLRRSGLTGLARPEMARLGIVLAAGVMGFLLSASISRPYSIWDRQFHVPLVTMLGHQRVPFLTVFQSNTVFHFHFAGDVLAAALQVFSFGRLHASLALALAHDLAFALAGICVAAWLTTLSSSKAWILPAVLALFLSGPFALQRVGLGSSEMGYSYLNLLDLSYRPSISITIVFLVGAFGALGMRLSNPAASPKAALLALVSCLSMLAISDEPSAAILGLAVAAVWVVQPSTLHPRRPVGFGILTGLAAAIVVPNLLFQAALVPGGPAQNLRFIAFRSPGFSEPPLPLGTEAGRYALWTDLAPFLLVLLAFAGASLGTRPPRVRGMTVVLGAVLVSATLGLISADLNGMNLENHRFMTICEIVFPIAAVVLLARLPAGRWERLPLIGALLISAISTFHWYQSGFGNPDDWFTNFVDCRASAGAGLFEAPRPTYVPRSSLYSFAGCRPVFVPGGANTNSWSGLLLNGYPIAGKSALEILHRDFVPPSQTLRVACPSAGWQDDPVCAYAVTKTSCMPAGQSFTTCELSAKDRVQLLAMAW